MNIVIKKVSGTETIRSSVREGVENKEHLILSPTP